MSEASGGARADVKTFRNIHIIYNVELILFDICKTVVKRAEDFTLRAEKEGAGAGTGGGIN